MKPKGTPVPKPQIREANRAPFGGSSPYLKAGASWTELVNTQKDALDAKIREYLCPHHQYITAVPLSPLTGLSRRHDNFIYIPLLKTLSPLEERTKRKGSMPKMLPHRGIRERKLHFLFIHQCRGFYAARF